MSMDIWCRHFTGIHKDTCRKGINYETVKSLPPLRMPCLSETGAPACQHFEGYTQAEIDEHEQALARLVNSMNTFWTRETEDCPHCGKHVTSCEQIGRCVYANPCGCRVGQGRLHANWK